MDFYAVTAIIQLIIIVFLIFFYTQMDPNYANNTSQELDNFIFSGTMVLFVFFQIIVMVIDRYLYLAKKFIVVDHIEMEEEVDDQGDENTRSVSISEFGKRTSTIDITNSKSS